MLRWRLVLGTAIVAVLVGAAWLDHVAEVRWPAIPVGIGLLPVAIFFGATTSREVLELVAHSGARPASWAVYGGNLLMVVVGWFPPVGFGGSQPAAAASRVGWPLVALAVGVLLVLLAEMCRYRKPGTATANVAAGAFALVYVGLMVSFAVQLRMIWGVAALASLLIVVKMTDTGAYTVGRLIGRRRMAPVLSPGKTIEGAVGGLGFACLASWLTFGWLVPAATSAEAGPEAWRWVLFALLVGGAAMLGDLAESLLKRDAGCKDSSQWLPGLGGVLDQLDSILVAAPVAWFCWAVGLVGG